MSCYNCSPCAVCGCSNNQDKDSTEVQPVEPINDSFKGFTTIDECREYLSKLSVVLSDQIKASAILRSHDDESFDKNLIHLCNYHAKMTRMDLVDKKVTIDYSLLKNCDSLIRSLYGRLGNDPEESKLIRETILKIKDSLEGSR